MSDPDEVLNTTTSAVSPIGAFHYASEPLYGYYDSADPFVLARHVEEFVMAGVDYLVFDTTNASTYNSVVTSLCDVFLTFQKQGWKVPRIAFYTNSASAATIDIIYNTIYAQNRYSSLWYMVDGKPLIIGVSGDLSDTQYNLYTNFFYFKESQWPDKRQDYSDGFPWMDWSYPQSNFKGTVSVSVAQGPGYNMADPTTALGRGYSFKTATNDSNRMLEGSNFEEEWETAINGSTDKGSKVEVKNAFVTGWNEWMAIKQNHDGTVVYCDDYNREFSRDIEMENGPLGDNFYLQLFRNMRSFKYEEPVHYNYDTHTIDFGSASSWDDVSSVYLDLEGEAMKRDHRTCVASSSDKYTDDSARNDIASTSITHDSTNLYVKVTTKDNLTTPEDADTGWMNLLINTFSQNDPTFANNFNFRVNASRDNKGNCSIEKSTGGYVFENVGTGKYSYEGKTLQISIPLSVLGKTETECHLGVKVTDHITKPSDIMDYYVSGDSAPIGRLAYEYGY